MNFQKRTKKKTGLFFLIPIYYETKIVGLLYAQQNLKIPNFTFTKSFIITKLVILFPIIIFLFYIFFELFFELFLDFYDTDYVLLNFLLEDCTLRAEDF